MGICFCRIQSILFGTKPYKVLQGPGRDRPPGCTARPDHEVWLPVARKAAERTAPLRLHYLIIFRYENKTRNECPLPMRLPTQILSLCSVAKSPVIATPKPVPVLLADEANC